MQSLDLSVYLVTQSEQVPQGSTLESVVSEAIKGGVTLVQLREKTCETRTFLERARSLKKICDAANVPLLINDRIDIALAVGAAGVHVGQDDMPISEARRLLPKGSIVGVSAGTVEEALEAAKAGADYLGVGACWATGSKSVAEEKVLGPRGIKTILDALACGGLDTPVVVIGGVNDRNIRRTLHGCTYRPSFTDIAVHPSRRVDGVAVISAIVASPDPRESASRLAGAVRNSRRSALLAFPRKSAASAVYDVSALLSSLVSPNSGRGGVIHHITNTVVQNDCANCTLALRSSPIMSGSAEEAEELAQLKPGCLVLNLGTLSPPQVEAMITAGQAANRIGKGVVCDPVAVGASQLRRRETFRLLNLIQMTIIKGNMGEIATIAGQSGASSRGVDSLGALKDPARVVRDLARTERCIVVMTGKIDYVSDGLNTFKCENGVEMLSNITGSGCMTGSSIGCFAAAAQKLAEEERQTEDAPGLMVYGNMLAAALAGVTVINVAAELAMNRIGPGGGPNTFRSALIDAVYNLDVETLRRQARISEVHVKE